VPTVPLTASNAQAVSGNVALASAQLAQKVQNNDFFLPLGAQASSTQRSAFGLSRFLAQEIARISEQRNSRQPAAAPSPVCSSGSFTTASGSDSVSEIFDHCVLAPGQSINGAITVAGISATQTSFSAGVSMSLTFSATGFADQTFSGAFGVSQTGVGSNQVTTTISGTNLALTDGTMVQNLGNFSLSVTTDLTTDGTTGSVTFMFTSDEISGTVAVTTLTPFETTPGRTFPHTGAIQIKGLAGSTIRLTVNGDETGASPQLTIQLDADGDGVFETTLGANWSDFG